MIIDTIMCFVVVFLFRFEHKSPALALKDEGVGCAGYLKNGVADFDFIALEGVGNLSQGNNLVLRLRHLARIVEIVDGLALSEDDVAVGKLGEGVRFPHVNPKTAEALTSLGHLPFLGAEQRLVVYGLGAVVRVGRAGSEDGY